MQVNIKDRFVIIAYVLNYIRFYNWGLYIAHDYIFAFLDMAFAAFFILFFILHLNSMNSKFEKSISVMGLLFLSIFITGFFIGRQGFYDSMRAGSTFCFPFFFLCYLRARKIPPCYILKLFKMLGIGWGIVLILSYMQYPNNWFGVSLSEDYYDRLESEYEKRGVYRFSLPCGQYIVLAILYMVENSKVKILNILKIVILFILTLFFGARYPVLCCAFTALILYLSKRKVRTATMIGLIGIIICTYFVIIRIPAISAIANNYINISADQADNGKNDIRLLSSTYFFSEFNKNNIPAVLFGNGVLRKGEVADRLNQLKQYGFYADDVGYAEMYVCFGLLGMLVIFTFMYRFIRIKTTSGYEYIKFYMIYIIVSMFGGRYFFANILTVAMCSYILICKNQEYINGKQIENEN